MRIFLPVFALLITQSIAAQRGFLLVKKNDKTVGSYTTGADIRFTHKLGFAMQGVLAHVRNDSFSVLQYRIIRKGDMMGAVIFDTIYSGYTFFHTKDIATIERRKPKGTGFKILGGASILGGGAMAVLNIVNGRRFGYKNFEDYAKPIATRGLLPLLSGMGISKLYKTDYIIKRKYSIAVMQF